MVFLVGNSITFLKLGEFLEDVPFARSDSIFCGIEKQALFLSIFELRKKMLFDKKLRKHNKKQLTNELFKIIKNKQFDINKQSYLRLLKPTHGERKLKTNRLAILRKDVTLLLNNPEEFIRTRN